MTTTRTPFPWKRYRPNNSPDSSVLLEYQGVKLCCGASLVTGFPERRILIPEGADIRSATKDEVNERLRKDLQFIEDNHRQKTGGLFCILNETQRHNYEEILLDLGWLPLGLTWNNPNTRANLQMYIRHVGAPLGKNPGDKKPERPTQAKRLGDVLEAVQ